MISILMMFALASCSVATALPPIEPAVSESTSTLAPSPTQQLSVTPSSTPTPVLPEYLQVHPDTLSGVKVRLWTPWVGDPDAEMQALVKTFNQQNEWGIQLEMQAFGSSMALGEELARSLDQGSAPQVVLAPDEQLARWEATQDLLVDLTGYLDHPVWGLQEKQREDFSSAFWSQGQMGSKQMAIPAVRTAYGLIYNRSWAAELGFSAAPVTPEQFYEQACAAAQANNTGGQRRKYGTGGWLVNTDPEVALSWLAAFGADPFPLEGQTRYRFDQPEVEAAFSFYRRLQEGGCLWEGVTPTPYDYFSGRFTLFYSGTLHDLPLQAHVQERDGNADEWSFLPYPSLDGKGVLYARGDSYAVLNGSPEEQMAAWLVVRWLSSPDAQMRLARADLSLPVGALSSGAMTSLQMEFPWNTILPLAPQARPVPALASWALVRSLLQDAAWQVLRLPDAKALPQVIIDLEAMSIELTE